MGLPEPNIDWPPRPFDKVYPRLDEWAAWYTGDPVDLTGFYGSSAIDTNTIYSRHQLHGGVVGFLARMFWGIPRSRNAAQASKLHVPLAEDIAAEGGKQVFKNPPSITVNSTTHQDLINDFIDNGLFLSLLQAAELGSALGDVYLRSGYDLDLSSLPLVTSHPSDLVIPEFRYGHLSNVCIWRELEEDSSTVFRHIEFHEPGWIVHRLFQGTIKNLGKEVALTKHAETASLEPQSQTGLDELDVIHVPNLYTRLWRKLGQASNLGRSDFGSPGVITLMDALDETYTSLMRDIRLGKFRLLVSQSYLDTQGPGKGATFDLDKEVFTELNIPGYGDKLNIVPAQAQLRIDEHVNAGLALAEKIISGCGYSAQTFGLKGDVAMTATESNARERKTSETRDIKLETWAPRTGDLTRLMLKTMVVMGKSTPPPDDIEIEFPPFAEKTEKERAETVQMFRSAQAMSLYEAIKERKPEWTDEQIEIEIGRIQKSVVPSSE